MQDLFLDFETYYDKAFSLRKMTTTEYIYDERFAVHGFSAAFNGEGVTWYEGDAADMFLASVDWDNTNLVCHNTAFDGAILSFHYGYKPALYSDTMSMSNYFFEGSASLNETAKRLGIGSKTDGLVATLGMAACTLPKHVKDSFVAYAINDTVLCRTIYNQLKPYLPYREIRLIDLTIRMFTLPSLIVNPEPLERYADQLAAALLDSRNAVLSDLSGMGIHAIDKTLSSNKQFAGLLNELGIEIPTKLRKPTKTEVSKKGYDPEELVEVIALGKNDESFQAMFSTLDEDSVEYRVCQQRMDEKSRINETRSRRFAAISRATGGVLPVPLRYMAAHTGRWTARDSINLQNLPGSRSNDKTLRKSLEAPAGYRLVVADLAQIEPRVLAWFGGEQDLLTSFASGKDIYITMHNIVFSSDYDTMYKGYKADDPEWVMQRNISKGMVLGLGYGMGHVKFASFLKTMAKKEFSPQEAKRIVTAYRSNVTGITGFWKDCGDMVTIMSNKGYWESRGIVVHEDKLIMPSGNWLEYPNISTHNVRKLDGTSRQEIRWGEHNEHYIYSGLVAENIVQGFARDVMGDMVVRIANEVIRPDEHIANLVHDEVIMVIREDRIGTVKAQVRAIMSTAPDYCKDLPVSCSIDDAANYGDAK